MKQSRYLFVIMALSAGIGYWAAPDYEKERLEWGTHVCVTPASVTVRVPRLQPSASTSPSPVPEPLQAAGVSSEDIDAARELQERKQAGAVVLKTDDPVHMKSLGLSIQVAVDEFVRTNAEAYGNLFGSLGLPPGEAAQLLQDLGQLQKASLTAEATIRSYMMAQVDYRSKLKEALTPEQYASYQNYELWKPAQRELAKLSRFADRAGAKLQEGSGPALEAIFQETGSYSKPSSGGPFDGVPNVFVGDPSDGPDYVASLIARAQHHKSEVLRQSQARGLDRSSIGLLESYYEDIINRHRRGLEHAAKMSEIEKRLGRPPLVGEVY